MQIRPLALTWIALGMLHMSDLSLHHAKCHCTSSCKDLGGHDVPLDVGGATHHVLGLAAQVEINFLALLEIATMRPSPNIDPGHEQEYVYE